MFPEWTVVVGFWIGATFGSFLNMAIYRLPRDISFLNPAKSMCPACRHSLGPLDLVPLLSWIFLRGRCRYCRARVSSRYLFVELLTGALWAGVWWQYLIAGEDPARSVAYAFAISALVAVIFIDWETFEIPDSVNALLLAIGLLYHGFSGTIMTSLWGAFTGWAVIWGIAVFGRAVFKKDAMGHGDILLMRGIGSIIGAKFVVCSIALAVVAGAVFGLMFILIAKSKGEAAQDDAVDTEYDDTPESFKSLFLHGFFYLACLDVVSLFFPKVNLGLEAALPGEPLLDSADWKPSLTHIPFGPYLAVGTIICMLFPRPIEKTVDEFFEKMSTPSESFNILVPLNQANWGRKMGVFACLNRGANTLAEQLTGKEGQTP